MITRIISIAVLLLVVSPRFIRAQGMPLDSMLPRITSELHNPALAGQLRTLIPDFANVKVWGFATGDFSNDSLPDLALSLFDLGVSREQVHIYLFENVKNANLFSRYERMAEFVESPIEVGVSIEGSVVTIARKTGEEHWSQEGYTIEFGDVILVDRFETEKETLASGPKARSIGHDVYRNYETLRTKESYFTGSSGDALMSAAYFTLPSYNRLRELYPGYGRSLSDTSKDFIVSGASFRRDAQDLSIKSMLAAYNDEFLYITARVQDDYVIGGQQNLEANDRISFWFDTKYTGDRLNRDRRLLSKEGGFPTFRNALDSLVYNITFALPARPGKVTNVGYSTKLALNAQQREALNSVVAQMAYDTSNGVVNGYRLTLRIPFTFFGFETNPARLYETRVPSHTGEETSDLSIYGGIGEAATLGFTALAYDVDDAARTNEVTMQATSKYEQGNPSSFGTLVLEPSTLYYGEVHPTYLEHVHSALLTAGY
jgi:hypothetical protein